MALPSVYRVRMSDLYEHNMSYFNFLTFEWAFEFSILSVHPSCLPGGFLARLLMRGASPLALMLALLLFGCAYSLLRSAFQTLLGRGSTSCALNLRKSMLNALPAVLFIAFCVCSGVSTGIFASWACEKFEVDSEAGTSRAFLTLDLRVECDAKADPEYARIMAFAMAFVAIWPVGVPLLYLALLLPCRRDLLKGRSTRLTRATAFLHRE